MYYISHRGNTIGIIPDEENDPQIIQIVLENYDVEIDVRITNFEKDPSRLEIYLGHDLPQYKVDFEFLQKNINKLWIHCKTPQTLTVFDWLKGQGYNFNYFFHDNDLFTLTSKGIIWGRVGDLLIQNQIQVLPEQQMAICNIQRSLGICSDYIEVIKTQHFKEE